MRRAARRVLPLSALLGGLALPAFAQPAPVDAGARACLGALDESTGVPAACEHYLNDEQKWTLDLRLKIPRAELEAAARQAEKEGKPDALAELAVRRDAVPGWLAQRAQEQGAAPTLAALGDSITAAMASCPVPYLYCPANSWSTGSTPHGVRRSLEGGEAGKDEWRSFLVAVPGTTMKSAPLQAFAVFLASRLGVNVRRATLLTGHNDPGVCGADKEGAEAAYEADYRTALSILGWVARARDARLFASSLVEVPVLARYEDVKPVGAPAACRKLWDSWGICSNVLQHAHEPERLAQVSRRIADYDAILKRESSPFAWVRYTDAVNGVSGRGLLDPARSLSPYDCFHPSAEGQDLLGAAAWSGGGGLEGIADFFKTGTGIPAEPARPARAELKLSKDVSADVDAWSARP